MSTDDAADALEGALRNAYDVLGRRPETVSTLNDDRTYRDRIQHLESQLARTRAELEARDHRVEEMRAQVAQADMAAEAAVGELATLKSSSNGWLDEKLTLMQEVESANRSLNDLNSKLEHTQGILELTKLALQEAERSGAVLQSSLSFHEKEVAPLRTDCDQLRNANMTLSKRLARAKDQATGILLAHVVRTSRLAAMAALDRNRLRRQHEGVKGKLSASGAVVVEQERTVSSLSTALKESTDRGDTLQAMLDKEVKRRSESKHIECQAEPLCESVAVQTVSVRLPRGASSSASLANVDEVAKLRWELSRMRQSSQFENTIAEKEIAATMIYVQDQMEYLTQQSITAKEDSDRMAASFRKLTGEHAMVHKLLREMEEAHGDRCEDIAELREQIAHLKSDLTVERDLTASLRGSLASLTSRHERHSKAHSATVGRLVGDVSQAKALFAWAFMAVSRLVNARATLTDGVSRLSSQRHNLCDLMDTHRKDAHMRLLAARVYTGWERAAVAGLFKRRTAKVVNVMSDQASRQASKHSLKGMFLMWRTQASLAQNKRDDELIAVQLGRLMAAHEHDVQGSGSVLRSQLHQVLRQVEDTSRQLKQFRTRYVETAARNEELDQQLVDAGRANAWLSDEAKSLRDQLRAS